MRQDKEEIVRELNSYLIIKHFLKSLERSRSHSNDRGS